MDGFPPSGPITSALSTNSASGVDGTDTSMAGVAATDNQSTGQTPAAPAACLYCRGKHLKCDGNNPCSRCSKANEACVYIASRRGVKAPRRDAGPNPNKRPASESPPKSTPDADGYAMVPGHRFSNVSQASTTIFKAGMGGTGLPSRSPSSVFSSSPAVPSTHRYCSPFAANTAGGLATAASSHSLPGDQSIDDKCFDAYYFYFFGAHPFVLPKAHLVRLMKTGSPDAGTVVAAIRYVGSLFVRDGPASALYLEQAISLCFAPDAPKDGFRVQALLLIVLGLDGSSELDKAKHFLAECEQTAMEIQLHTRLFAATHGRDDPVLEESWRRTWWDLYCCDAMFAGAHQMTHFPLFDVPADALLPCEEHEYISGAFDDMLFTGDDRPVSSFTYRVASSRIVGKIMRTPAMQFPDDQNVTRNSTLLVNWRLHLPESKKRTLDSNCRLDEMMFAAHFMNRACTIMLHQPLSQLDSSPVKSVTICMPHRRVDGGTDYNEHTGLTMWAACEITRMASQAAPLLAHTPFFVCALTLSSIVHLSRWAAYLYPAPCANDEDDLRQQIRLNVGVLRTLSGVWKSAATACVQIRAVAEAVYHAKKAQHVNPAFWEGHSPDEVTQSLSTDEAIMSEFEVLPAPGNVGGGPLG